MRLEQRVLHVIDTLNRGGAERMAVEIANAAVQDGHEVTVCVTRNGIGLAEDLERNVRLIVVGRRWRFDPKGLWRLASLERDVRPTVVHCHGISSFSLVALLKVLGRLRVPVVLHDHLGRPAESKAPVWFRALAKRSVAKYIAVEASQREWAVGAGLARDRITVICNRICLDRVLRSEPNLPADLKSRDTSVVTGLMVGGVRREKGLEVLIEASRLIDAQVDWRILVVGPVLDRPYHAVCRRLISSAGLQGRFVFAGERDDVPSIAKACDFGVVPSIIDSGPLVLVEFLAAGIPIVSTRVGQTAKNAEKEGITAFVDPSNPEALAEALTRVMDLSSSDRVRRGDHGRRVALELFDIHDSMPEFYEVYSEVGGWD